MNGILTGIVVVIVVIVLVAVAAFFFLRAKARREQAAAEEAATKPADPFAEPDLDAALRGDPNEIKAGDLVEIRGHDWAVRGTLRLREGSFEWAEHLLDDAEGDKRWLSVEQDPDLELALWSKAPTSSVSPGPRALEVEGRSYQKDESGTANFRSEGTTGLDQSGTMRYHDYRGDGGALLSFEDYGDTGKWELAQGETLNQYDVRIFPGG